MAETINDEGNRTSCLNAFENEAMSRDDTLEILQNENKDNVANIPEARAKSKWQEHLRNETMNCGDEMESFPNTTSRDKLKASSAATGSRDSIISDITLKSPNESEVTESRTTSNTSTMSSLSEDKHYCLRANGRRASEIEASVVRSSTKQLAPKRNEMSESFTINKLRIGNLGFYGRRAETSTLLEVLKRSTASITTSPSSKCKELVLIHGHSGVGKSTLAKNFEKTVREIGTGMYSAGKFDLLNREKPYLAISAAYGNVFRKLIEDSYNGNYGCLIANSIQENVFLELDTEIELLGLLIPRFKEFCKQKYSSSTNKQKDQCGQHEDFPNVTDETTDDPMIMHERLKHAVRVLTRILTTFISPLVIVLDDLQWMDAASSSLINALMTDQQNSNSFIIIGTYRSNEVDDGGLLSHTLQELENEKESSDSFGITKIELGNLGIDEVNQTLMALLSIDDALCTYELAKLCHRRTLGNPHFVLEFMKMLAEKEFLAFNLGLFQWTWDLAVIESETASTENVVDLLHAKMRLLPLRSQKLLAYAACLDSTFRLKELKLVWEHQENQDTIDIAELLSSLEKELFLETCYHEFGTTESNEATIAYRWVHDKVQEAALSLIGEEEELAKQHFEIGLALYRSLNKDEIKNSIFNITNLINYGSKNSGQLSFDFAELNLWAAEKAKDISAFETASKYASSGIKFLPKDHWVVNSSLTVRLYSIGAEMHSATGQVETMNLYCNYILRHQECSALDKLRVCKTKANILARTERNYEEAIKICINELKLLGCHVPTNKSVIACRAAATVLRTSQITKRMSLRNMDMVAITDSTMLAIMQLLDRVYYYSYMSSNTALFLLSLTRIIKLTDIHGVCPASPVAFVTWGMITGSILGNFEAGSQLAETAIRMQEIVPIKSFEAKTSCYTHVLVLPWTTFLHEGISPLLNKAYKYGMQAGEIEPAMLALSASNVAFPFILGRDLKRIEDGCHLVMFIAKQVKSSDNVLFLQMVLQAIMNLTDRSDSTIELKGTIMNEDDTEFVTPIDRCLINYTKSFLCVVFGEHDKGAALAVRKGNEFAKSSPGNPTIMHDAFLRGVSLYAMARKSKKRKFAKHANGIRRLVKGWMRKGNPNVARYVKLFNAEQAVLEKKYDKAESLYREAIRISARGGHLLDGAISNERYTDFLLNVLSDNESANHQMGKSIRLYEDWGASRKVAMLEEERKPSSTDTSSLPKLIKTLPKCPE